MTANHIVEPFSILKRIEPPATKDERTGKTQPKKIFQYPQTDRTPCNIGNTDARTMTILLFQYPQTDRTPCNRETQFAGFAELLLSVSSNGSNPLQPMWCFTWIWTRKTFSILKRIEPPATSPPSKENHVQFSQKWRDRPSVKALRTPFFVLNTTTIIT